MADRRVGKRSMGRRGRSGTCTVCSAPCSSCMHLNSGLMGSKSDESSDETCHETVTSQCSVNEDDVLRSSRTKPHKTLHNTAGEASNLVTVNSSHDALSENAESRAIVRSSDAYDDSEDVEMPAKMSSAGIGVENQESTAPNSVLDQSNLSNKKESSIRVEGHGDKILCDDGSGKGRDCKKLDLYDAPPKEAKSQAVHDPSSNPVDINSPARIQINENSGAEIIKDSGQASDEAFRYSNQKDKNEKSGKRVQSHDPGEPNSPPVSEHESDDSEMMEQDVKVCDICGDAGREDLLAICSRCSDGAEHIYCMRDKLQQVPEGEWLCEECKFAEEAEKQKRGSPKSSNSTRLATLSRDSSFKGLDKVKTKLAHQTSFPNHSNDDVESIRSTGSQLQSLKGTLFKSSSFNTLNSKPKVKLVDDVVLPRQKGVKEHASLDIKEVSSRTVGKSMSFKSTNIGSSYGSDAKVNMFPSKFSHPQEMKGSKQVKERSASERKDLCRLDHSVVCSTTSSSSVSAPKVTQKLTPRGNSASLSYANNSRELKGLQSDGKLSSLTKQASNISRNRAEVPVTSVGESSTNEMIRSSTEQNSNQTNPKDEPPSTSSGSFNRPRSNSLYGSKGLTSQKEGHAVENRPIDAQPFSDSDLSVGKNFREEMNLGNRLRVAVDAAIRAASLKKPSFGKNRGLDQSDGSSASNMELNCERTLQLPVQKMFKNSMPVEVTQGGQSNLRDTSDPYKQTIATNGRQLAFPSSDAMSPPRSGEVDSNVPSVKSIIGDLPLAATTVLSKTLAIPEHEYIWQGGLEVQRGGNLPELHRGIQAHLSTLASSKVLEVVNKFPERVSFNEVPRLSTWPAQFHEGGAKEDHIALFFFAKDSESYERSYKSLVDNMIKKDLALKGKLDGVELLIFASNQLPQNCQRWNMLFFLWGVFRGKKDVCSSWSKTSCIPSLNVSPQDEDFSNVLPQTYSSSKHIEKESYECESPCSTTVASETRGRKGVTADEDLNNKESSSEQSPIGSEANSKCPKFSSRIVSGSTQSCRKNKRALLERAQDMRSTPLQGTDAICDISDSEKTSFPVSGDSLSRKVQPDENKEISVMVSIKDQKMPSGENLATSTKNPEVQSIDCESTPDRDPISDQVNHRKRTYVDLTEPATENSSDMKDKIPVNDLNSVLADEGSMNKKLRTDSSRENVCSSPGNIPSVDAFSSDERCDLGPGSSAEKRYPQSHDERVINKNLDKPERYFFPVDLNQRKDFQFGDDAVPNLELALGAEEIPFLSGLVNQHDTWYKSQDKITGEEKEEDVSASLSLSLSFPFPEKEQTRRSKAEPQRQSVNTSLLLFRDLPDK